MKTEKYLLATLALPMFFAACSADEELTNAGNQELSKNLVAIENPSFVFAPSTLADTRITSDGKWELTDEVGLAFTNWAGNTADGKVYNNARLFLDGGNVWKAETVIYEGTHFAYYPYDKEHQTVKKLVAKVGSTQKAAEGGLAEFQDKGRFSISPLKTLDNETAGYGKPTEFNLFTLSNRLGIKMQVSDMGDINGKDVKVKRVTLKATDADNEEDAKIFAQEGTIKADGWPAYVTTNVDGLGTDATEEDMKAAKEADAQATLEAFDDETNGVLSTGAFTPTRVNAITTAIEGDMILSKTSTEEVDLFTFPTKTLQSTSKLSIEIVTNYGTVTIDENDEANEVNFGKLKDLFNGTGVASGEKTIKYTERGEHISALTFKVDMTKAVLENPIEIRNSADWESAVESISMVGSSAEEYVFKLASTATIKDIVLESMTLPTDGKYQSINVQADDAHTLSVGGEVALDGKLNIGTNVTLKIGGSLTFGSNMLGEAKTYEINAIEIGEDATMTVGQGTTVICDDITNNGTLTNNGTISTATTKTDAYIANNGEFVNNGALINKDASDTDIALVANAADATYKHLFYASYTKVKIQNNGRVVLVQGNFRGFKDNYIAGGNGTVEVEEKVETIARAKELAELGCDRITVAAGKTIELAAADATVFQNVTIALEEGATLKTDAKTKTEIGAVVLEANAALAQTTLTAAEESSRQNLNIGNVSFATGVKEKTLTIASGAKVEVTGKLDYSENTVQNNGSVTVADLKNENGTWKGTTVVKK